MPKPPRTEQESLAEQTLRTYEQLNLAVGHENAGFLSRTHGYLPIRDPLERLDDRFSRWEEVARELPLLYRELRVRTRLDKLEVLDAAVPDAQLLRACALLGMLAHRDRHVSQLGREMLAIRAGYPPAWRAFLTALAELSVNDYITERGHAALHAVWREVRDVYIEYLQRAVSIFGCS